MGGGVGGFWHASFFAAIAVAAAAAAIVEPRERGFQGWCVVVWPRRTPRPGGIDAARGLPFVEAESLWELQGGSNTPPQLSLLKGSK